MYVINDNVLDEIRDRADIVDLIGEYVDLKRSGSNYMGLCPFHSEKTPSFSVSPSKSIFKCFGCGVGGDVITFVMKRENLSFPEAVEFLADKYNVRLEVYKDENKEAREKRNRLYEINREAGLHFLKNYEASQKTQLYLKNRMLSDKTIRSYGIGYSKDSWTDLYDHLTKMGYREDELLELNLISKSKNGNYIDRFRDRVMFPIINRNNRIIGFGARAFGDAKPKYLNSRETPIFHKGSNVFNINIISRESTRERIILVEGYMDVISLYNSGINYSVASLGTSLTIDQANIIKKMARDSIFSLADKIDTIAGLFAIGEIPTGSTDPFALRRSAIGVINIIRNNSWKFNLDEAVEASLYEYINDLGLTFNHEEVIANVRDFFLGRIKTMLQDEGIRYDIIDSVLIPESEIHNIFDKAKELNEWFKEDRSKFVDAYNRINNLTKNVDLLEVKEDLLVEEAEKDLYMKYLEIDGSFKEALAEEKYKEAMDLLNDLVPSIDKFFDNVMVMAEDDNVRENRLGLINRIEENIQKILKIENIVE
ncbi:DNA primase [Peptoniphilus genitalis]